MNKRKKFALQYLTYTLEYLKQGLVEGFAYMWLEEIIELSFLNGFEQLMNEALVIRSSPDKLGDQLKGAITNLKIEIPKRVNYKLRPKTELIKKYSYQNVIEYLEICKSSDARELLIDDVGQLESALSFAKDDLDLEMIAAYLCINGHIIEAQSILENELANFDGRIWVIKAVMCIELLRRNEFKKAMKILSKIYPEKNNPRTNLLFAKGALGYQPWGGYPFSDY